MREIAAARPDAVILVGFCGGAHPDLSAGDLNLADSFINPDTNERIGAHRGLLTALESAAHRAGLSVSTQPSATVAGLANADDKQRLHHSVGAASVNMEDFWAGQVASEASIPFASVRSVFDPFDAALPEYLGHNSGHAGRVAMWALARPRRLPGLLRLARLAHIARHSLTACVASAMECPASLRPAPAVSP